TVEVCTNDVSHNEGCVFDKEKHAFTTDECLGTGTNLKTLEKQIKTPRSRPCPTRKALRDRAPSS
ncbi:hypothetical protein A2U01_0076564, partial [Trifolium medium]|nr:hypothetical protein [Trifolium medium]